MRITASTREKRILLYANRKGTDQSLFAIGKVYYPIFLHAQFKYSFSRLGSSTLNFVEKPIGYKLFSCSTQLSMEFRLLIKTKMLIIKEDSCYKSLSCCFHHANKC